MENFQMRGQEFQTNGWYRSCVVEKVSIISLNYTFWDIHYNLILLNLGMILIKLLTIWKTWR